MGTSLEENRETYRALAKYITTQLADTPFTVAQLRDAVNGRLQLHRGDGVHRPLRISESALYDRLTFLTQIAITSARPRVQRSLAYDVEEVRDFVTKGAFYRTFDDHYVWDSGARWFWESRVEEARLWNPSLPLTTNRTILTLAVEGTRPRKDRKAHTSRPITPSIPPLSRLPEGVVEPPLNETELPGRDEYRSVVPELVGAGSAARAHGVANGINGIAAEVVGAVREGVQQALQPAVVEVQPPEPFWQVLANDGEVGGTIVLQSNDHVIMATISTVVSR